MDINDGRRPTGQTGAMADRKHLRGTTRYSAIAGEIERELAQPDAPDRLTSERDLAVRFACQRGTVRIAGLGLLAILREHLGSLDEVTQVVRVLGMVNCTTDFTEHMSVINACSDLLVEVFGQPGQHARTAIGVGSLPMNIPVVIEAIVEVRPASAGQIHSSPATL